LPVSTDRSFARAWLVDKHAGPTSHDIVRDVRRRMPRGTKVGHAGTLDPFATGLLVILSGRATRLADRISGRQKSYRAVIQLGQRSETGDPEGPITPGGPLPSAHDLDTAIAHIGQRTRQQVPAYSAVRVDGERLYQRVRRGETVALPERDMEISHCELVAAVLDAGVVTIDVTVSKGTYIRQIAVDLGEILGCGAYCAELRRTAVGPLTVDQAIPVARVPYDEPIALSSLMTDIPHHVIDDTAADGIVHGRAITLDGPDGEGALVSHDGQMIAIARIRDGMAFPNTVLFGPDDL